VKIRFISLIYTFMEGLQQVKSEEAVGVQVVEEINDYENAEIRDMLADAGMVVDGDAITPEDYEAIKSRAKYLAEKATAPISTKSLLFGAFVDRMEHVGKSGVERLKDVSDDVIKCVVRAWGEGDLDDEEISLFRSSRLPISEWMEKRASAKGQIKDIVVVIDANENVIKSAETPEVALLRAQEAKEGEGR